MHFLFHGKLAEENAWMFEIFQYFGNSTSRNIPGKPQQKFLNSICSPHSLRIYDECQVWQRTHKLFWIPCSPTWANVDFWLTCSVLQPVWMILLTLHMQYILCNLRYWAFGHDYCRSCSNCSLFFSVLQLHCVFLPLLVIIGSAHRPKFIIQANIWMQ